VTVVNPDGSTTVTTTQPDGTTHVVEKPADGKGPLPVMKLGTGALDNSRFG